VTSYQLELSFVDVGGGTYKMLVRSDVGTDDVTFYVPGTAEFEEKLNNVGFFVSFSSGATVHRTRVGQLEEPVRAFGKWLSRAVFTPGVRHIYEKLTEEARQHDQSASIVVQVSDPVLQRPPWELMWDDSVGDYFSLRVPIMRTISVQRNKMSTPLQDPPLNVLVVTANPSDYDELAIDQEKERLEQSLAPLVERGLLKLSWLPGSSWRDLKVALQGDQRWHVLHFIGHGGFDDEKDEGYLALVQPEGTKSERVTAVELARLLESQTRLRLVVLNACNTGQAGADEAYAGTAATLVRNKVDSVVAMQYPVSDQAAAKFTEALYSEIVRSPVDQAVTRARVELAQLTRPTLEWATPVLYMRTPDSLLFDLPVDVPSAPGEPMPAEPAPVEVETPPEPASTEFLAQATDALTQQDHDGALNVMRQHQEAWPDNHAAVTDILVTLADAYRARNKLGRAQEVLELAVGAGEPTETLRQTLADVTNDHAQQLERVEKLVDEAEVWIEAEHWGQALSLLRQAHEADPDNDHVRTRLQLVERELDKARLVNKIAASREAGEWRTVFDLIETEPMVRGISEEELTELLAKEKLSVLGLTSEARAGLLRQGSLPAEEELVLRHRTSVRRVGFSPEGTKLMTCAEDGYTRAWWTSDGDSIQQYPFGRFGRGYRNRRATFDLSTAWITTVTTETDLDVYHVFTGKHLRRVELSVASAGISAGPAGLVATAAGWGVEIWDIEAGVRRYAGYRQPGRVTGLCFAGPERELLLTVSDDLRLCVWSVPDEELLLKRELPHAAGTVVADLDGRCVAVRTVDGRVVYWPVIETDREGRLLGMTAKAVAVDVSQDGRLVLAACVDRTVSIFDVRDGVRLKTLTMPARVNDVGFAPDGWSFAIACEDGLVRVYRLSR
jgi:CHAT domain